MVYSSSYQELGSYIHEDYVTIEDGDHAILPMQAGTT